RRRRPVRGRLPLRPHPRLRPRHRRPHRCGGGRRGDRPPRRPARHPARRSRGTAAGRLNTCSARVRPRARAPVLPSPAMDRALRFPRALRRTSRLLAVATVGALVLLPATAHAAGNNGGATPVAPASVFGAGAAATPSDVHVALFFDPTYVDTTTSGDGEA